MDHEQEVNIKINRYNACTVFVSYWTDACLNILKEEGQIKT